MRATWQKRESAENSTTQAATKEEKSSVPPAGAELLKEATADQHWLAVGHDYHDEAANVGRSVSDGVLFKIAVNISGRKLTALIDSGASRCYIAPEIAAICELHLEKEKLHLEFADGSKVQSAHKAPNVPIVVGKTVCKVDFTVTQLLFGVDLVLGINWLALWNPVIDWTSQKMNIWIGHEWTQIQGLLLQSEYNTATVQDFVYCGVEKTDPIPDFIKMKEPTFWDYDTEKNKEWKRIGEPTAQACKISKHSRRTKLSKSKSMATIIQQTKTAGQRQIILAKQIQKEIRRGNTVYLALVLPKSVLAQGMMQQRKRDEMKLKGAVRKAPPIAKTRKKFCADTPRNVQKELHQLLEEFSDLFPEQLLKGRPPRREVEFEIKLEEGAVPPNKPPYRLSPKEHEELQAQIDDLLAQGHIRPSQSPYRAPVLFVPKKDGRWCMCVDYRALNKQTIRDRYPLPRIDDLLDRLGKAKHFTTLDLASSYHQIAVKDQDIPKTVFRMQRG